MIETDQTQNAAQPTQPQSRASSLPATAAVAAPDARPLVERLRSAAEIWGEDDGGALYSEAAGEIESLRKDAERYRWLREREVEIRRYSTVGIHASERLDYQIDAAIEEARAGAAD